MTSKQPDPDASGPPRPVSEPNGDEETGKEYWTPERRERAQPYPMTRPEPGSGEKETNKEGD
jgi:hypothetical protein